MKGWMGGEGKGGWRDRWREKGQRKAGRENKGEWRKMEGEECKGRWKDACIRDG